MSKTEGVMPVGMSRRTVVRAGATAAWTVPAITVLAAAPAYATASGEAVLAMSGTTSASHPAKSTQVSVSSGVANSGGLPANNLQATVTLTGVSGSNWGAATSSVPSGWTLSSSTKVGADQVRFVFTATPTSLAGGATKAFAPVITLPSKSKMATGSVTVTFTAVTGAGGSLSATSGAVAVP